MLIDACPPPAPGTDLDSGGGGFRVIRPGASSAVDRILKLRQTKLPSNASGDQHPYSTWTSRSCNMSMWEADMVWKIAEAKQRFSELVKAAEDEPQWIYNRDKLVAAMVPADTLKEFLDWRHQKEGRTF